MKGILAAVLALLLVLGQAPLPGGQGAEDLRALEEDLRTRLASAPESRDLHYNLGTVLHLQGRHEEAREHLERAEADPSEPFSLASYNLGNTDLQPAFTDEGLPEREARLRRAIESYKRALLDDPEDEDAKWNLELARRLLERDPPQSGGGGGDGGDGGDGGGVGGVGGEGTADAGQGGADPRSGATGGPAPAAIPQAAEELLQAAQEREVELQRDRLQKPQPPGPIRP